MTTEKHHNSFEDFEEIQNIIGLGKFSGHKSYYPELLKRIETLQASEENLKITLNSIGDAVISTDTDGNIANMNPVAETLTGWPLSEAKGKQLIDIFAIVNAQTREPIQSPVKEVLEKGTTVGLANHTLLIAKDGKEYQIADSAAPIRDRNGRLTGVVLVFRDQTQEYFIREQLKENEALLSNMFESIQDGISILDRDLKIVKVNRIMKEWYAEKLPLEGQHCYRCYQNNNHPCKPCPSLRCLKSGQTEIDIVPGPPDSPVKWIELFSFPIKDRDSNEITGVVEFVRNITEQKQAEEQLRRSEEKFRGLVESSSDWIWETDHNGVYTYVSPQIERILGYTPEEIIGKTPFDMMPAEEAEQIESIFKAKVAGHEPLNGIVNTNIDKNGQFVILETSGIPFFDEHGQLAGYRGIDRDISDRIRSEKALRENETRFRELFENMSSAVAIYDVKNKGKDFIFKDINPAGVRIGQRSREEHIGRNVLDLYPGLKDMGLYDIFRKVWITGKPQNFPTTAYRDKRLSLWVENYVCKLPSGEIVAVYNDITEQKKAETEREHFIKLLESKNKELQSIVYIASHDLKSPLVNISGFSTELEKHCKELEDILQANSIDTIINEKLNTILSKEIPESLQFITNSTEKMQMLLNGLLQVSRIGIAKIDICPLDMNLMFEKIINNVKFKAKDLGATITVDTLPPCLGDISLTNQIFSNLLDNALKYLNPDRPGIIHISGNIENNMSVYCIEDNGIGIASDHIQKIFEVFHRLNPADTAGGEGLGLTIVMRAIERLNGCIRVESEPEKGSKFIVSLPAV